MTKYQDFPTPTRLGELSKEGARLLSLDFNVCLPESRLSCKCDLVKARSVAMGSHFGEKEDEREGKEGPERKGKDRRERVVVPTTRES